MTQLYYKDINLHNLKSLLFENLQYYDHNYLDKKIDLGQILSIEKQTVTSFMEQFNNKIVCPENINLIIKLGEFLLIDRKDIQQFIIENSISTLNNYKLNDEFNELYELPIFMISNQDKKNNLIIETLRIGLLNWVKFGLEEKLYWDNQCYYYVLKNNNIELFQCLKQLDMNYNYEYFSESGPVNIFFESLSNINYIQDEDNIQFGDKTIGDLIFIDQNNLKVNVSSCPNSAVISSSSSEDYNLSSFLINHYKIYQVITGIKNSAYKHFSINKTKKLFIKDNQLFLSKNINSAKYPSNWLNIFNSRVFYTLKNNIKINIPIYLNSLDFDDSFFDISNNSLCIRIIKENYFSFNYIIFNFSYKININNLENEMLKTIFKQIFNITSDRYIRGIVYNQNILVKNNNLHSIYDIKQLIKKK